MTILQKVSMAVIALACVFVLIQIVKQPKVDYELTQSETLFPGDICGFDETGNKICLRELFN